MKAQKCLTEREPERAPLDLSTPIHSELRPEEVSKVLQVLYIAWLACHDCSNSAVSKLLSPVRTVPQFREFIKHWH